MNIGRKTNVLYFSIVLDPLREPEGSYKVGSVRPSVRVFLGILSLVFSEFRYGARNSYEVMCDRDGVTSNYDSPVLIFR